MNSLFLDFEEVMPIKSGDVILMTQKHASYTGNGMHQLHGHLLLIKHSWCAVSKGIYVSAQDLTTNTFLDEIYLPYERYELLGPAGDCVVTRAG